MVFPWASAKHSPYKQGALIYRSCLVRLTVLRTVVAVVVGGGGGGGGCGYGDVW